ncbi:hypothetical protein FGO68_gene1779 [Halteria grandinella]|uniref:Serine/threonine protein phosphatase 2A regulatory subunit n=1 Tax=Halteria grandinella TaxID=5974 RepID=A0A8J8NQS2_HALGN|nr:hypothetical protein FGO68_gene1779 [Halteria grandinella]
MFDDTSVIIKMKKAEEIKQPKRKASPTQKQAFQIVNQRITSAQKAIVPIIKQPQCNLQENMEKKLQKMLNECLESAKLQHRDSALALQCEIYFKDLNSYLKDQHLRSLIIPNLNKIVQTIQIIIFRPLYKLPQDLPNLTFGYGNLIEYKQFAVNKLFESIYTFMYDLFQCDNIDSHQLREFLTPSFINQFIGLFDSEVYDERSHLKTFLHRIYAKFVSRRKLIRKAINDKLLEIIYEDDTFKGTDELLNILVALINGFSVPLSIDNIIFFRNVLIPLHKVRSLLEFKNGLWRCTMVYLSKDRTLAVLLIKALLKYWPFGNSEKEIHYIELLKEVLEVCEVDKIEHLVPPLFKQIAKCISGSHLMTADRAMCLFEEDHVLHLLLTYKDLVYPFFVPLVMNLAETHWHPVLKESSKQLSIILQQVEPVAFEQANSKIKKKQASIQNQQENRKIQDDKWESLNKKLKLLNQEYIQPELPFSVIKAVANFNELYQMISVKIISANTNNFD